MDKRKFFLYNVLGAIPWGAGVTLLGAWLGHYEWVGKNLDLIFIVIVLISVIPIIVEFVKARSKRRSIAEDLEERLAEASDPESPEGR
jgi:membrane-associated protein